LPSADQPTTDPEMLTMEAAAAARSMSTESNDDGEPSRRGAPPIDRKPLQGASNGAYEPGNRFRRRCASYDAYALDAQDLASIAGEPQTRASATGK
jgi:hypothetical protein